MGDSERWWPELASGLSADGAHSFRAAFGTFRGKGEEWWAMVELRAAELIIALQPNRESELRRQAVVDHITKLIQSCVNCQVVKFGSVPLKTYLPDGDIDLTVVSPNLEVKRTWIDDVHEVLQKEIDNPKSEFRITQVQLVVAEVKLIKICVEKLLVDVSFDQLGGVCTLCFLEEVDRLIEEDHLFKRSIILVKAWCYYESRLLGANCNLMSTYALETLVLYIFHLFHSSLRGPLQVLYLFLEFFSSFDWDKYCVSLSGPVPLASFSEETESQSFIGEDFQRLALSAGGEGGHLLFTKAFLDACERTYGSMRVNPISKPTKFAVKSLNIIDPLRSTNNLGRSVNQGNCARIRRAFVLGARTLRGILHGSEADVCSVLDQFFKNCIERYDGSTLRPDVAGPRSWPVTRIPNGVQRLGGGRRSDSARTERSEDGASNGCISENGDPAPQASLKHPVLRIDPRDPTVRGTSEEALRNGVEYEGGVTDSSCAVDVAKVRAKNAGDLPPVAGEEVAALNLRNSKIAVLNVPNGDLTAHDSRPIDEELVRGDVLVLGVSDTRRGLLPLSCRPDDAGAETEAPTPSTSSEPLKSVRNEARRDFSVPMDEFRSNPGIGIIPGVSEMSQGSVPVRNGKVHQQNGTLLSNDVGFGLGHVKRKRGPPGKEKGYNRAAGTVAHDGGQVGSSGAPAHSLPQQFSSLASVYQPPLRHSSADYAASGTSHFQTSQSRSHPSATGPGSFRHPLANSQFDPGTTGGNTAAPSQSSDPQSMPSYYLSPVQRPPEFPPYSPTTNNFHNRYSHSRGDGSSVVSATSRTNQGTVELVPNGSGVDSSRSHRSQSKVKPQVAVGIVERLEAGGKSASTSSRRNQTASAAAAAARSNTHGAGVPNGIVNSSFLSGDLNLHLDLLEYGRFCEDCCSPSAQLYSVGYPAYGSEQQHSHTHGSWEGPGRPAQLMGHPVFYSSGPGWLPQAGYLPQFQPYWGSPGVELSPRPRGTGTYLPNS